MKPINKIEISALRDLLQYDAETGVILWAKRTASGTHSAGSVAGHIGQNDYRRIGIHGFCIMAHRAAWALHYGEHPKGYIDHINGDKSDNRISNLRVADHAQNRANSATTKHNRSGFSGVRRSGGKWMARLKQRYLGTFDSAQEASDAYKREAELMYGEYAYHVKCKKKVTGNGKRS